MERLQPKTGRCSRTKPDDCRTMRQALASAGITGPAQPRDWAWPAGRWLALLLFAGGFAWTFRHWLFTGFDAAFGDEGDGIIALAIVEHWRHALAGEIDWTSPLYFFPERGTLGYTDALFLIGAPHAALRALGVDPFTALMLVMAALAAIGFFGFIRLAQRHLALPPAAAAVGAFLFAFANVDAVKLIHVQSYCAMLLPLLGILLLAAWQSEGRLRTAALAAAAGLLYAALFLTAYQTAWFAGCYALLLALLHPFVCGAAATRDLAHAMLGAKRPVILGFAVGFAAGIAPFLRLYLPVLLSGRSRDFAEVIANAPEWRDLFNVTPGNLVWGSLLQWLGIVGRPNRPAWEAELAFTPLVMAAFALGVVLLALRRRQQRTAADALLLMGGLAVVIGWLLQMNYGGVRPWLAVWTLVPGAGAVRYIFRSQLVANLFVAALVARLLAELCRRRIAAALPVAALLLVEQFNLTWPATMPRRATLAWVDAVSRPPPGCRVFYVLPNPSPAGKPDWEHQADAMLLSELRGLPTINGYSSWFPAGWALEDPASPNYPDAVRAWARQNGLGAELCGLDPREGSWTMGLP